MKKLTFATEATIKSVDKIQGMFSVRSGNGESTYKVFDEVINSYFWCLEKSNPAILYAPSTSMMVMQKGAPCGQFWKDVNIFLKKFIIAPLNPTDYHWTLVAVDLQEKKIIYLDPLQNVKDDSRFLQLLSTFMPHILEDKFGLCDFVVVSSPHTLEILWSTCLLVCTSAD